MATRKLRELKAKSLAEFVKHIEDLLVPTSDTGNWYRGVSNAVTHTLKPSLFRHPVKVSLEDLIMLEARMLEDFERQSILHTGEMPEAGDLANLQKLFFMQHYGIPTRLLDWTTNPFIGLYFALSTAKVATGSAHADGDAAVWVLNPIKWNRAALEHVSHGDAGPLGHTDAMQGYGPRKLFSGEFEPSALKTLGETAACMLGITNSARMYAQRGVFTIFGKDLRSMEDQWIDGKMSVDTIAKIIIPSDKVFDLLRSVLKLGYTDSVSYPDLHGLAMEIKRSRGFRV